MEITDLIKNGTRIVISKRYEDFQNLNEDLRNGLEKYNKLMFIGSKICLTYLIQKKQKEGYIEFSKAVCLLEVIDYIIDYITKGYEIVNLIPIMEDDIILSSSHCYFMNDNYCCLINMDKKGIVVNIFQIKKRICRNN